MTKKTYLLIHYLLLTIDYLFIVHRRLLDCDAKQSYQHSEIRTNVDQHFLSFPIFPFPLSPGRDLHGAGAKELLQHLELIVLNVLRIHEIKC